MKICYIFGTRPEALKMAPVILEGLKEDVETYVLLTGQHKELLDEVIDVFDIPVYKNLNVMKENQSLEDLTSNLVKQLTSELRQLNPDYVLVHGDTSTSFCGALSAFYNQIPVAHVEAGLRTDNIYSPFPEEINRRLITQIANINFCPTAESLNVCKKANKDALNILTGNTIVDTLEMMIDKYSTNKDKDTILITTHRRENFDCLSEIYRAIVDLSKKYDKYNYKVLVHPNPNVKNKVKDLVAGSKLELLDPVSYPRMIELLSESKLVLTDSGGLQEETPSFGIPVVVLRNTTERPEGVDLGIAKLVGTNYIDIFNQVDELLSDELYYEMSSPKYNPYGNGDASKLIIKTLLL